MKYDKNKKYTHDEMMRTAINQASDWYGKELYRTVNVVLNMVFMALKDIGFKDIEQFDVILQKYIKDFGNGEFNKKDLVNYVENEVLDVIREKAKN